MCTCLLISLCTCIHPDKINAQDSHKEIPMRAVDIIIKKRDKAELTLAEIEYFIKSFISGEVTDYQASALLMAIVLNGMTPRETTDLTLAMANSGHMLDLSDVVNLDVDK